MQTARQGRRTLIGAIAAVLLVGGVSAGAWAITRGGEASPAVCGDAPVADATVITYGLGLQSAVGTDFAAQHEIASYGSEFWGQEYDGTRPVDALAAAVSSALTADCALTRVAQDLGVDTSTFRAVVDDAGGADAYERIRSRAEELKDAVRAELLEQSPPDDAALRAAFAGLGDVYKQSDLAVTVLRVRGGDTLLGSGATDTADLRERLIAAGADVEELQIDSQEISKEDLYSSQILEAMQHAEPGSVIDGFADAEKLVLVDKRGGGLLTVEQAPQLARNAYVNDLLEQRLTDEGETGALRVTADLADLLLTETTP